MPRLPEFQQDAGVFEKRTLGEEIPGDQGSAWNAAGKVGTQIENLGFEAATRRKQADDTDYAFNAHTQDQLAFADKEHDLQLNLGSDPKGYTDQLQSWINDRFEQNQKDAPSDTSKRLYQRESGSFFTSQIVQASNFENKARAQSYKDNLSQNIDDAGNMLVKYPDAQRATDAYNSLDKGISSATGNVINQIQADEYRKKAKDKIAQSLLGGLYTSEKYDDGMKALMSGETPQSAAQHQKDIDQSSIQHLQTEGHVDEAQAGQLQAGAEQRSVASSTLSQTAKSPLSSFMDGLSPSERESQILRFKSAKMSQDRVSTSAFFNSTNDLESALQSGRENQPPNFNAQAEIQKSMQTLDLMVKSGSINEDAAATKKASIMGAKFEGDAYDAMKAAPADQMDAIKTRFMAQSENAQKAAAASTPGNDFAGKSYAGFKETSQAGTRIDRAQAKVMAEREKDPADYVYNTYPKLSDGLQRAGDDPAQVQLVTAQVLARQDGLGINKDDQRILTQSQANDMAVKIQNASPTQANALLTGLQRSYGKYSGKVLDQLVNEGDLPDSYKFAAQMNPVNSESRTQMLANIQNAPEVSKNWKAVGGSESDLKKSVASNTGDLQRVFGDRAYGGGQDALSSINDQIMNGAKRIHVEQGIPIDAAVKQAKDSMIGPGKGMDIIDDGKSSVLLPSTVGNSTTNKASVQNFMSSHLDQDEVKKMNLQAPTHSNGASMSPDAWSNFVSKNGKWVTNDKMDGLNLQLQWSANGAIQKQLVMEKNGKPKTWGFSDLSTNPDATTLKAGK